MRLLKFFCFKWTIATGTQVTGYLNLWQTVALAVLYTVFESYEYLPLILLPLISFYYFHQMMKKDGIKPRRRNFVVYIITTLLGDIV